MGYSRKLTETRLKNAEKGKDWGKGASEEGDKNGEKSRKWGKREKSFFCQEQLFHIYRRDIPRACRAEEGVGVKERDETKRGAFFQTGMCCHPTKVFINYAELTSDSARYL